MPLCTSVAVRVLKASTADLDRLSVFFFFTQALPHLSYMTWGYEFWAMWHLPSHCYLRPMWPMTSFLFLPIYKIKFLIFFVSSEQLNFKSYRSTTFFFFFFSKKKIITFFKLKFPPWNELTIIKWAGNL